MGPKVVASLVGVRHTFSWAVVLTVVLLFGINLPFTHTKRVLGLSEGGKWDAVANFCFSSPSGNDGFIEAQAFLLGGVHSLIMMEGPDLPARLSGEDSTQYCERLSAEGFHVVPLGVPDATGPYQSARVVLNVPLGEKERNVIAVITRCGGAVSAEYLITFSNPDESLSVHHFDCQDQGLVGCMVIAAGVALVAQLYTTQIWRNLRKTMRHNKVTETAFLSGAAKTVSVLLLLLHVQIYARGGFGSNILWLMSLLLSHVSGVLFALVLLLFSKGVLISGRSLDEQADSWTAYTVLYLACAQCVYWYYDTTHQSPSPLTNLTSMIAFPYLVGRLVLTGEVFVSVVETMRKLVPTPSESSTSSNSALNQGDGDGQIKTWSSDTRGYLATNLRQRRFLLFVVAFGGCYWAVCPILSIYGLPLLFSSNTRILNLLLPEILCPTVLLCYLDPANFNFVLRKGKPPSGDALFLSSTGAATSDGVHSQGTGAPVMGLQQLAGSSAGDERQWLSPPAPR